MTEVLVVAECWHAEPDAEAVVQRAIAVAAETVVPTSATPNWRSC